MDETWAGRFVHAIARWTAVAGGLVLVAMIAVTLASVAGRALIPLGLSPVLGDYELIEAGMAFAVFAFLPWCQLTRGNAIVAVLTDRLPVRANAWIEVVMDGLAVIVAVFIGWRHFVGMLDKLSYAETSFILRFPLWWPYAAGLVGAAAWVIVSAYGVVRAFANATSANPAMPNPELVE